MWQSDNKASEECIFIIYPIATCLTHVQSDTIPSMRHSLAVCFSHQFRKKGNIGLFIVSVSELGKKSICQGIWKLLHNSFQLSATSQELSLVSFPEVLNDLNFVRSPLSLPLFTFCDVFEKKKAYCVCLETLEIIFRTQFGVLMLRWSRLMQILYCLYHVGCFRGKRGEGVS